jgi:hypothetical protein
LTTLTKKTVEGFTFNNLKVADISLQERADKSDLIFIKVADPQTYESSNLLYFGNEKYEKLVENYKMKDCNVILKPSSRGFTIDDLQLV